MTRQKGRNDGRSKSGLIIPQQQPTLPSAPPHTIIAHFDEKWDISMTHHPDVSPFKLIAAGNGMVHGPAPGITVYIDYDVEQAERKVVIEFSEDWMELRITHAPGVPDVYLRALGKFMVMRGEFILDMSWARNMQMQAAAQVKNQSMMDQISRQGGLRPQ